MRNALASLGCLVLLLLSSTLSAQTFYETAWNYAGVRYDGLIIYYEADDILVRVRYTTNDVYRVAEFDATAEWETNSNGTWYIISGEDARIVYGDKNTSYAADNFIFPVDENGNLMTPYTIDNSALEREYGEDDFIQVSSWNEVDPAVAFTEKYVYNYFDRNEDLYNTLLSYNPSNVVNVQGVHGAGTTGDGEWKVFMSQGTGFGLQSWFTRYEWPKADIKKYWDEGKHITDLSYGDGLWMVAMTKGSGYGLQSWNSGANWPNDWIEKKWDEDKMITEVAYGDGKWAVVMSSGSEYSDQRYIVSKKWPKEWLNENWKTTDYIISSLAYGAGHWVIVLSKIPGKRLMQRIRAGDEFPSDEVSQCWQDGYDVTTMAYGDEWVVILTKGYDLVQSYEEGSSFPKTWVKEKWDGGYAISEAIYTYREPESSIVLNFVGTGSSAGSTYNTLVTTPSTTTTTTTTSTPTTTTPSTVQAVPNIHLVVVANTLVPDIGRSCEVDRDNIIQEFTDMSDALGIKLKKYVVDGSNLNKAYLNRTISNMSVGSNDVVVFAYSGHGFRWSNQSSEYPQMALFYSRFDAPSNDNSINLKSVYDQIVAKGARLNIVLGDCCNNDIGYSSREGAGGLASRSYTRGSTQRLRQLFFESRGNIIAMAAKPGETACGSKLMGGYFLNAFFSAIDKEVSLLSDYTPKWDNIMSRAMKTATYKTQGTSCGTQHGIYKSTVY